ncbi:MAG: glycosyltransferase [Candidatus Berkelbacteria bacterium Gr01-1014_85]|uniref:Glycosyltransferase n=1 Tax=Candidatus Berkelbacteria bacterium Gr01-1014_85 TaxID=2017150 RepID=A0A554JBT3_9BACT|nr:MAG: glycosyltransferase [Candidatus Berkelbacteria bacterium Gr01-1014_85]
MPVGTHLLERATRSTKPEYFPELVFLGILSSEQGIELLLEAWPKILAALPSARLTVIGSGPLAERVRHSQTPIRFLGYLPKQTDVDQYLAAADIGLAPYEIKSDSFKQFTDPGKIKSYLGAGLPIVMTNISAIAQEIELAGAGKIVTDDIESLVEAVVSLATNSDDYEEAARAAQKLAQRYLWHNIFDTAFDTD